MSRSTTPISAAFIFILFFVFLSSPLRSAEPATAKTTFSWSDPLCPTDTGGLWTGRDPAWTVCAVAGEYLLAISRVEETKGISHPDSMPVYRNDLLFIPLSEGDSGWQCLPGFLPADFIPTRMLPCREGTLVCLGKAGKSGAAQVFLVSPRPGESSFLATPLAGLPVQLRNPAAMVSGNLLYLFGGANDGIVGFRYPLQHADGHWEPLPGSLPGIPSGNLRSTPSGAWDAAVGVVQSDGFDPCLYVFYRQGERTGAFHFNPRLNRWTALEVPADFPAVNGFTALPLSTNHILFAGTGGRSLYTYHTLTNTLTEHRQGKPQGVGLIHQGERIYGFGVGADEAAAPGWYTLELTETGSGFAWPDIVVIFLYFASLAAIGFYFSRRQKSSEDYFKSGGRIPWWAAGISLFGTALSAITFMAIPAKAYATDWSYTLFNLGIVLVAPVIVFLFISFYRKLNITTAYQYLEARFNPLIRVICSLAFILFQVGRMGVVMFLPALALNVVTGMDIFLSIALMGVFSIVYTMVGGIEAVVWTDTLQVIILIGGAIFALVCIAGALPGGFSELFTVAADNGKFSLGDTAFNLKDSSMWTVLIAACFTHLTTYGTDQSMVQRYLTTTSQQAAQKSVWTNALLTIPATLLFFFIGTALFVFYKTFPQQLSLSLTSNDAIFPSYIFSHLPAGISGLLISGVFAAAMSTTSGSMNSAATAFVVDIRSKWVRREDKTSELRAAKLTTLVVGSLSLGFAPMMATWNINSLWDEFNKILGLILGSMGGLFLLGMVIRRANSQGAIVGIAVSILVQLLVARFQAVHLLLYTASGFVSCFAAGYLASFFFNNPSKK
ncbi:MAG: sodium:solute symporter [Rikenellaceae bacterium]|nr:sodium:solute symporter [Rikenellaceae bacterium]